VASGTIKPNALVDNSGLARRYAVYDSFGNRLSEADRNAAGTIIASTHAASVDTIFGYTGREYPCKALLKPGAKEENSQSIATNLGKKRGREEKGTGAILFGTRTAGHCTRF